MYLLIYLNKTKQNKIEYIFFNTGLEFEATKKHLIYLEEKYNIKIQILKPKMTIPQVHRKFGTPFKSKQTSEMISRLQHKKRNFDWKDINKGYEYCMEKYPNAKGAFDWLFGKNITMNCPKYLREYLAENGLDFQVQNKCCQKVKKDLALEFQKENKFDCHVTGMRKAEGGQRQRLSNCYFKSSKGHKMYHPLLHWTDDDKKQYNNINAIKNSDCYEVWGMKRTGCAGCPFGRSYKQELELIEKHEPKMHKAVLKIFGEAYELNEKIEEFRKEKV